MSRGFRWWESVVECLDRAHAAARRRRRRTPRRLARFEALEPRQLLAADSGLAEAARGLDTLLSTATPSAPVAVTSSAAAVSRGARLASRCADETLAVPGPMDVHFFWDGSRSAYDDELGYFFVDGPDGRITLRADGDPEGELLLDDDGLPQYVRPGEAGYAEAALAAANAQVLFAQGEVPDNDRADTILEVPVDGFIAFYVIQDDTTEAWRDAADDERPAAWFSLDAANADGEHFRRTTCADARYRRHFLQYKVEDTSRWLPNAAAGDRGDADFNDLVFSVNLVPLAGSDDYSVFNTGADFSGPPAGFQIDTCGDTKNRGLGLLWNDKAFNGHTLRVTDISLDEGETWQSVVNRRPYRNRLTLSDPSLHGTLTVYPSGGIKFVPDAHDAYWYPAADDPEPEPIWVLYRASDGIDETEAWLSITHGFYQSGAPVDGQHDGQKMYFLAGGGDETPFEEAWQQFFLDGSAGGDIVLIAQGTEQKEFVDYVVDFADGQSRSVTALNITTREQANDRRIAQIVDGADLIWFGGGAQSFYQKTWAGTRLFTALAGAAASNVAIGGTSAGLAILGQMAYVDLPWDSIASSFATQRPNDPRVHLVPQTTGGLPFAALSQSSTAPLHGIVMDTHFGNRDRMGRLLTFAARARMRGLGVDQSTAVLIEEEGGDWLWSIYGEGYAYFVGLGANGVASYEGHGRLTFSPVNVYRLEPTGAAGASTPAEILAQPPTYQILVSAGTVYTTENGGSLY